MTYRNRMFAGLALAMLLTAVVHAAWGQSGGIAPLTGYFSSARAPLMNNAGDILFTATSSSGQPSQVYLYSVASRALRQITSNPSGSSILDFNERGDIAYRSPSVSSPGYYELWAWFAGSPAPAFLALTNNGQRLRLNNRGDAAWGDGSTLLNGSWQAGVILRTADDGVTRRISANDSYIQFQDLNDQRQVLWTRYAGGSWWLDAYDDATGAVSQMGGSETSYYGAQLNNRGDAAWNAYRIAGQTQQWVCSGGWFGTTCSWQLSPYYRHFLMLRLAGQSAMTLSSNNIWSTTFALNDRADVLWQQEQDSANSAASGLYARDGIGGAVTRLTSEARTGRVLGVNEVGDMVWDQGGWGAVMRLANGQMLTLPAPIDEPAAYLGFPALNDRHQVAYLAWGNAGRRLMLYPPPVLNTAPVAAIAPVEAAHPGQVVTLDGSASSDADGDALTYAWTLAAPAGSTAALSDPAAVTPSFTVDVLGEYAVTLTVNDGQASSAVAGLVVSTRNAAPVAAAGPDQAIMLVGTAVQLDGSGSFDPDGDALTYAWSMLSRPAGSTAALDVPNAANPGFVADVNGSYELALVVTDAYGAASPADTVLVSFTNVAPVASAGGNQSVVVGSAVTLGGSGTDANGDPLTYRWSLTSVPAGSLATLAGDSTPSASFTADLPGTYVAALIVNDGLVDSPPASATVQVVTLQDATTTTLVQTTSVINSLPTTGAGGTPVLKNSNMGNALTNKINAALADIEAGNYASALTKLQSDILGKTDGCAVGGKPDKNDWINTCAEQAQVYAVVTQAIAYLQALAP